MTSPSSLTAADLIRPHSTAFYYAPQALATRMGVRSLCVNLWAVCSFQGQEADLVALAPLAMQTGGQVCAFVCVRVNFVCVCASLYECKSSCVSMRVSECVSSEYDGGVLEEGGSSLMFSWLVLTHRC